MKANLRKAHSKANVPPKNETCLQNLNLAPQKRDFPYMKAKLRKAHSEANVPSKSETCLQNLKLAPKKGFSLQV